MSEQQVVDDALTERLLAASRVVVGITAQSLAKARCEISVPQWRALLVICDNGQSRLTDVATALNVGSPAASKLCDRLVAERLITREVRSDNRREVDLTVTPAGKRVVAKVLRARREFAHRIEAGMSAHQRRALLESLDVLIAAASDLAEGNA